MKPKSVHQGWPFGHPFSFFAALLLGGCVTAPQKSSLQSQAASWDDCAPVAGSVKPFPAVPYDGGLPMRGQWRDGFVLVDMNGDDRLDLAHGPARKGRFKPVIFLGNGQGRFTPWTTAHFPPLPFDYGDVAAADINNDGMTDLVLSSHLRGMVALIQEVPGHFTPWGEGLTLVDLVREPGVNPFSSRAIAMADWNGDGRDDLMAVNEGPARWVPQRAPEPVLAIFLDRRGYWERVPIGDEWRGFGDSIATGDLEGDGRIEIVHGTQVVGARGLLWRPGTDAMAPLPTPLRALPAQAAVTAVAMLDVDDDGRDEVALAPRNLGADGYCSGLQVHRHAGTSGENAEVLWRERGTDAFVRLAIADINLDGQDDLIAMPRRGESRVFLGSANGLIPAGTIARTKAMAECDAFDLELADLDGTPGLEMIVSYAGDNSDFSGAVECPNRGGFQAWHLQVDVGR
jgi:hypothetical protein